MKTIYLVKKHPEVHGHQDNWITMNSYEFAMFMKTDEGKRRRQYFGEFDAVDYDDYRIVMECDLETAKEMKKEKDRRIYLRNERRKSGYITFSIDDKMSDDDRNEEEMHLVDQSVDVENTVITTMELESLRSALEKLSDSELELIMRLYLDEDNLTGEECGKILGLSRKTVHWKKEKILKKLRSFLE